MKARRSLPVLLTVVLALAAGSTSPAQKEKPEAQSPAVAEVEQAILRGVNEARKKEGLQPLATTEPLQALARGHSRQMAEKRFFSHESPGGETLEDRARRARIAYTWIGENIYQAVGLPRERFAAAAVESWMKSQGHRSNVLRPQFTHTGIGVWQNGNNLYATQVFIRPR
jgi:uncharacterized protein YkwD